MSETAGLLRLRAFRLLWTGHVLANFADSMTALALILLIYDLTGSTLAVAGAAIAMAVPQLLVGLPAGAMVDRWSRRRVMVASDFGRALVVLAFLLIGSADMLWLVYGVAFVQAAIGTFFNPARGALLAEIVPSHQLLRANSLSETARIVASLGGVSVAGAMAATGSFGVAFLLSSATFVLSALLVARVQSASVTHRSDASLWADAAQGLRLILGSRRLVGVIVAATIVMLGLGAANVLIVPFVIETLGASEAWFGPLRVAQVTSMILAGALLALLSAHLRPPVLIAGGLAGIGLSVAAIGTATEPWHLLLLFFLVGWFVTPVQASVTTILQTEVPPAARGRAQATFTTAVAGASLLSMGVAGAAADLVSVRLVFVACGIAALVAALASAAIFRSASLNHSKEPDSWPSQEIMVDAEASRRT